MQPSPALVQQRAGRPNRPFRSTNHEGHPYRPATFQLLLHPPAQLFLNPPQNLSITASNSALGKHVSLLLITNTRTSHASYAGHGAFWAAGPPVAPRTHVFRGPQSGNRGHVAGSPKNLTRPERATGRAWSAHSTIFLHRLSFSGRSSGHHPTVSCRHTYPFWDESVPRVTPAEHTYNAFYCHECLHAYYTLLF